MTLGSGEVYGEGVKLSIIVNEILANGVAYPFCLGFVGCGRSNQCRYGFLFVCQIFIVHDEEDGFGSHGNLDGRCDSVVFG